jgi:adenine-specific DNA-methyltransferase
VTITQPVDTAVIPASRDEPVSAAPAPAGEVFTREWVVQLILDLCGYTTDADLTAVTLLDPAVGAGAFLRVAVPRLLDARDKYHKDEAWDGIANAIQGFDIQARHVTACRRLVEQMLIEHGCPPPQASVIAHQWIKKADFLLQRQMEESVDYVVGNPPYVRIEDLDAETLKAYRKSCPTMTGRADIYIGFFEKALDLLKPEGKLGFICADRWMRNQYGRALRAKIVDNNFALDACLIMHDVAAFEEQVSAYPAVTVLRRGNQGPAITADTNAAFDASAAAGLLAWAGAEESQETFETPSVTAARLPHWHKTADSWPEGSPATIAWLEELDDRLPLLEDETTGTLIRIGVATGADRVYVTQDADVAEDDRMLKLAMAADIKTGQFSWTGNYLVNPWDEDGLVDIKKWDGLRRYLEQHGATVRNRAVAKKETGKGDKSRWYRTIDRVTLSILGKPKLLLEDMKAKITPVLAPGGYYPHHNLYYVISERWDLDILGGLLLSDVVERQVAAYCVKMRGRTLRFQAQYLRRVRVPKLDQIDVVTQEALRTAFKNRDRDAATAAALKAYSLESLPS